jgi:hypothetical protein
VSYLHARPLDGAFTRDPVGVPLPTTGGGQSWSETIVRARRWSALAVSMREGLPWFRSDSLCAGEHGRQDVFPRSLRDFCSQSLDREPIDGEPIHGGVVRHGKFDRYPDSAGEAHDALAHVGREGVRILRV